MTAEQAKTPLTLRIGVTLTYNDGRPQIEVNAGTPHAWKSALPEPSDQPKQSRGITRGTYRGNNDIFSFDIPPAALHAGTNTIDIHVEGGKKSYPGFLSPNIVFDAIDLVTTADAKKAAAAVPGPASGSPGPDAGRCRPLARKMRSSWPPRQLPAGFSVGPVGGLAGMSTFPGRSGRDGSSGPTPSAGRNARAGTSALTLSTTGGPAGLSQGD